MRRPATRWTCVAVLFVWVFASPILGQERTVELFAGNPDGSGYTDGVGAAARFVHPWGLVSDPSGNTYVADAELHTIRRIAPDGRVTTFAGAANERGFVDGRGGMARFARPNGLAIDGSRNLYVSDLENLRIRKISPQGVVTTLGGELPYFPYGVAVDSLGYVYVSLADHTIRRMSPTGVLSLVAGQAGQPGLLDGTGSAARFNGPNGLAIDASGVLFVADSGNDAIRKVNAGGTVTTFATVAAYPTGVAFDLSGNLVVTLYHSDQIRRITPGGAVSLVAGSGMQGSDDGPASSASFLYPRGVTVLPGGEILVADTLNFTVRAIAGDSVTTVAGTPLQRGVVDGATSAARFIAPIDIARDSAGNLFVLDSTTIRKITPAGVVSLFAGAHGYSMTVDGIGTDARFAGLSGIVIDSADNLYVTDIEAHVVRKITPNAVVTTFAGMTGTPGLSEGTGSNAQFRRPDALTIDAAGNLYVADAGNHSIRKVTPARVVTTVAGLSGSPGDTNAAGAAARFQFPTGIDIDTAGNLYVADYFNQKIRRIAMPGADVTTLAGSGAIGYADGTGAAALFYAPWEIEVVGTDVYVLDGSKTVRKVTSAGVVTTVAGSSAAHPFLGNVSGTGPSARFYNPSGLGAGPDGKLYLADAYAANLRLVQLPGIDDAAGASSTAPPVNTTIQLGPSPDTGETWTWDVVRRPAGSTAQLSGAGVRNPTFAPDVADLFRLRLRVARADGSIRYSTVDVLPTDSCPPLATVVATTETQFICQSAAANGSASVAVSGGGAVSIQWGYRTVPGGPTTPISGATAATLNFNGAQLGGLGQRFLVATVTSSCGFALASNPVRVQVLSPPQVAPTISAGSAVFASQGNNFASTPDYDVATTYSWSIVNGTIDAGQNARTIRYTAGASGNVTLRVTVNRAGCSLQSSETDVPIVARPAGASMLYVVEPCRAIDTRDPVSTYGGPRLVASGERTFVMAGRCGVPAGAAAVVVNVTMVAPPTDGFVALYPASVAWGGNSTMSYRAGRVRANNAVVPLSPNGSLIVRNVGSAAHMILDVTGYFQ